MEEKEIQVEITFTEEEFNFLVEHLRGDNPESERILSQIVDKLWRASHEMKQY